MSSILKALKKLEKETLERQDEPRVSMGLNIRSEKNRRQENLRGRNKRSTPWVWIASLFIIFLGAGTFMTLFSHDKPPQTKIPPPLKEKPEEIALIAPAPAETQESKIPMNHAVLPEAPSLTPLATTKALPTAIVEKPPKPIITLSHEKRVNKINNIDNTNEIHTVNEIHPDNEIPSINEIPILNNNSLIINAIAWSNDPAKRLAVINSVIVRQGQNIEGFLVVEIEEDQVIVQQSDKKWRVTFRLR